MTCIQAHELIYVSNMADDSPYNREERSVTSVWQHERRKLVIPWIK